MKKEHISDALNMLNDDIIEETNNVRTNAKPKRRWERQIATVLREEISDAITTHRKTDR